jgi:putative membrane protein
MKMNQCPSGIRCVSHGLIAAAALWTASTAFAADTNGQLDRHDANFIRDAAKDGEAEVQLGQMAAQKAENADVKALAQHIQMDHAKVNHELTQLAQSKGVTLPTEPARKEERAENRLQDKTGADFDKAFAEHVIKDHEKDIRDFDKALQNTKDTDVKAFIEKTLPSLRQHLQMARNAGAAVGVDQRTLSGVDRFLSSHNEGLGTAPGSETGTATTPPNTSTTGNTDQNRPK